MSIPKGELEYHCVLSYIISHYINISLPLYLTVIISILLFLYSQRSNKEYII